MALDVYKDWLGIPDGPRPPDHYTLLRLVQFEDNTDKMHAMAKALLEWETIDGEQIEDIMQGRPPRAPKDWSGKAPPSSGRFSSSGIWSNSAMSKGKA